MIKNITLGQYFPGDSVMHRMDPRMKFLLTLALIVLIFCVRTVYGYAAVVAVLLLAILLSRISVKYVLKGIKPLWFILVFTFILNIFFISEGEVVDFPDYGGRVDKGREYRGPAGAAGEHHDRPHPDHIAHGDHRRAGAAFKAPHGAAFPSP